MLKYILVAYIVKMLIRTRIEKLLYDENYKFGKYNVLKFCLKIQVKKYK